MKNQTATATPAQLKDQIETLRNENVEDQATLAEREGRIPALRADKEQSERDRGLYVLSHASVNGQAPDPTAAERRFNDNALAIAELQRRIQSRAERAADLEQQRRDMELQICKDREPELLKARGEIASKLQALQSEYDAADNAVNNNLQRFDYFLHEAGQFRNAGGRSEFMRELLGGSVLVPA